MRCYCTCFRAVNIYRTLQLGMVHASLAGLIRVDCMGWNCWIARV